MYIYTFPFWPRHFNLMSRVYCDRRDIGLVEQDQSCSWWWALFICINSELQFLDFDLQLPLIKVSWQHGIHVSSSSITSSLCQISPLDLSFTSRAEHCPPNTCMCGCMHTQVVTPQRVSCCPAVHLIAVHCTLVLFILCRVGDVV